MKTNVMFFHTDDGSAKVYGTYNSNTEAVKVMKQAFAAQVKNTGAKVVKTEGRIEARFNEGWGKPWGFAYYTEAATN